jgi:hypothetical protein
MDDPSLLSKLYTLTILSYGNDELFLNCLMAYRRVLDACYKKHPDNPVVIGAYKRGVPQIMSVTNFFTGLESNIIEGSPFLESLVEDGRKIILIDQSLPMKNGKFRSANDNSDTGRSSKSNQSDGKNGGVQVSPNPDSGGNDTTRRNFGKKQNVYKAAVGNRGQKGHPAKGVKHPSGGNSHGSRGSPSGTGGDIAAGLQGIREALAGIHAARKGQEGGPTKGKAVGQGNPPKQKPNEGQQSQKKQTLGQRKVEKNGAVFKEYFDSLSGEVVATHRIATAEEFNERIKRVSKGDYHDAASGLRESRTYKGSENIEMDTYRSQRHGVRLAGHVLLDDVSTPTQAPVEGQRLSTTPLNPEWLGGSLAANSLLFEQSRVNHVKLIYKSCSDPLEPGALAFAFENNPDRSTMDSGINMLRKYAQGTYGEFKVVANSSIMIKPSDMNVRYDADGGSEQSIQGLMHICTASSLAASKSMGTLYLEYDVEFWRSTLSQPVTNPLQGDLTFTFANANWVAGNHVLMTFDGVSTARLGFTGDPPDGELGQLIYVVTFETDSAPGDSILVSAQNQEGTVNFGTVGTTVYMRTYGQSLDYTNGTMFAVFYNCQTAAENDVLGADDNVGVGQLYVAATNADIDRIMTATFKAVPVA